MTKILELANGLYDIGLQPIPTVYKVPIGMGWQNTTEQPNGNFNAANVNGIGIVLGRALEGGFLTALDVDCYNPNISRKLYTWICDTYGSIPYRIGTKPKFLVPFVCTDTKITRLSTDTYEDGSQVEILGDGRQFVAHGFASEGVAYQWHNGDLTNDLPRWTMADVNTITGKFTALMVEANVKKKTVKIDDDDFLRGIDKGPCVDVDLAEVLGRYSAKNLDYDAWLEVGMAIYHQTDGEGYEYWIDWSAVSDKHDDSQMKAKWNSFGRSNGPMITLRTILAKCPKQPDVNVSTIAPKVVAGLPPFVKLSVMNYVAPREIIYGEVYIRGYLTGTAAPGGVGKTSLVSVEVMSMALGQDLLRRDDITGESFPIRAGQQKVLMLSLEDDEAELRRRHQAIYIQYALSDEEIAIIEANLFYIFDDANQLKIVTEGKFNDAEMNVDAIRHVIGAIKANDITVVTIDPLASIHNVSENDNGSMQVVMSTLRSISRRHKVSVHFVHHNRKGGGSGADDMRGAAALKDGARAIRMLKAMSEMEADLLAIPHNEAAYLVGTSLGKANFSSPDELQYKWFKKESVCLNNGTSLWADDHVGVITPFSVGDVFSDIDEDTAADFLASFDTIPPEDRKKAGQAKGWLGHKIADYFGLDVDVNRKKINKMIRVWLRAEQIKADEYYCKRRGREVPFYTTTL